MGVPGDGRVPSSEVITAVGQPATHAARGEGRGVW